MQIKLEEHPCDLKVGADDTNDNRVKGHVGVVCSSGSVFAVFILNRYHVFRAIKIIPHEKGTIRPA